MILFARRTGLHSLKYFKIIDDSQRDKEEHKLKGLSYTFPKFEVVDEEAAVVKAPAQELI